MFSLSWIYRQVRPWGIWGPVHAAVVKADPSFGRNTDFPRDARLRRVSRYRYNNAPLDFGGRYLYIRDQASGE